MIQQKRASGVSKALSQTQQTLHISRPISDKAIIQNFTIKIANTREEREAVFRLGYQVYLEKGYIKKNISERLICDYDFNDETIILMVQDRDKNVIGTATLVFDEAFELPATKVYQQELHTIKKTSNKNTELCRFVINSKCRNSKEILILLFNYAAIYIQKVKKYTGLVIEVTPRHKNFYKELMCFEEIGSEKKCPQVQNTIGVLLYLSTQKYQKLIKDFQLNSVLKNRSLFPLFIKPEQEDLVANYLTNQAKPMNNFEKEFFGYLEKNQNLLYI